MPRIPTLACLTVLAFIALGCASEPRGRIGVQEVTHAERSSGLVQPTALIEFSDYVPRQLLQDLRVMPLVRDTPGPITILLGDINNKTKVVSTDEFELVASRIRSNLINSGFRDELVFVERRARMERLAERERVTTADTEQVTGAGELVRYQGGEYLVPNYSAATTYALNGDFYRIGRSNTNLYYMEFQLVNFANNQIVFSSKYDVKQEN